MHFGKDLWLIIKIIEFVIWAFKEWCKQNNDDTDEGTV